MCAWEAALFLWQKDSFSCHDAQAFNRNSSTQVAACNGSSDFQLVTHGFSPKSSPAFPSSHKRPEPLVFGFIEHIFLARF
jgi:hypothetical protein